jgi:hypothetical protein
MTAELPFPSGLTDLQKAHLRRICETLQNMGVEFAIREPDGATHGNGTLEERKTRTRIGSVLPYGIMREYIAPLLSSMKPGEARHVPCPDFFPADWDARRRVFHLQRSITSFCFDAWGKGGSRTAMNEASDTVEVLRTEGEMP